MSDQDFFFDEEPAKAEKAAPKSTTKAATSKPVAKTTAAKAAPVAPAEPASMLDQNVSMGVAGMLAVVGILVGVIIGFLMGGAMGAQQAAVPPATTPAASTPMGSGSAAPAGSNPAPLTQEQMQQGANGQLPSGHPNISGGAAGSTTTPGK
ncbi:MAG: hypothetical protein Q7W30_04655 [Coriobacteriia bacterium]|nr:hypothetical protein [Coriobacteriia bacterium]